MQDLNDLFYFARVVEAGGFAAAGRQLGIPKSRLSRRIAELEERLGTRLLQRTTRAKLKRSLRSCMAVSLFYLGDKLTHFYRLISYWSLG